MTTATDGDDVGRLAAAAEPILAQAGITGPFRLEPITGGGNNRVFRVESGGAPVVLKVYFRHPDDPRDRLRADFGFSAFAWGVGARSLPQPLASNCETGMAVFEFVAGQKLAPGEVTAAHVAEAAAFVRSVNEHRADPRASPLPQASEACFSIADHLACVSRRLDRLRDIDVSTPIGSDAATMVDRRMRPAWELVATGVRASVGGGVDEQLDAGDRCLSPSDFGFHNAILAAHHRLRFLDFEYAGWDDPAKMACDFFCQPAVPVPRELLNGFVAAVSPLWRDPAAFGRRAALLLPVYELKWCCIMLNEFLPAADSRRTFAGAIVDREARRAVQLAKVASSLDRMGA
jgi:hypothetical protein